MGYDSDLAKLIVLALVLAGCSGEAPPSPDAGAKGAFGATCMVASDTSTECQSGVCTNSFDMLSHAVCSVKCTFGNDATCPAGAAGPKCNMKGYCKP